jgi:hypothetical protein
MTVENTYSYDQTLNPPAPVLRISVRNVYTGQEVNNIFALIDSGADLSTIPKLLATRLHLIPHDFVQSYDYEGKSHGELPVYYLTFSFDTFSFNVEPTATDADCILIGRDILNQIRLLLDGRSLTFNIS